jgi:hypothetical protein
MEIRWLCINPNGIVRRGLFGAWIDAFRRRTPLLSGCVSAHGTKGAMEILAIFLPGHLQNDHRS